MARKYKTTAHKSKLGESCTDFGEIEELKDEMGEWRDNLEGNDMTHLPKYEEVSEAADTLDNAWSELETYGADLESALEGTEHAEAEIEYTQMTPYKGRSYPRWMRMANSVAPLRAVVEYIDAIEDPADGDESPEAEKIQAIKEAASSVADQLDELDNVEFPGMFG